MALKNGHLYQLMNKGSHLWGVGAKVSPAGGPWFGLMLQRQKAELLRWCQDKQ